MSPKREQLLRKIEKAFKNTPHPGPKIGNLNEVEKFIDKTRQEISLEDINTTYNIFFFSPEGFHYFIPAYLIAILRSPDKVSPMVVESVVRYLGDYDSLRQLKKPFIRYFSNQQREAILEFLQNFEELYFTTEPKNLSEEQWLKRQKRIMKDLLKSSISYWSETP